jgi:type I restriction enzyme, S subunit
MPVNSIIFVVRGMSLKTEFRVGITKRPVAFGQDCKAILAKEGIDPLFLANVLRAKANDILGMVDEAGHGTGRLQTDTLKALETPLPPLSEQRAIASILGALDDKIGLNRRMNATLEDMARAIFQSWFVDFDPVRAKAEGRATGLPAEIAALFPDGFVESGNVRRPSTWRLGQLSDLLVLQRGFDLPSSSRVEGPYPVMAASGPSGTHNEYAVKGPGVTTGRSGVLGKVFLVQDDFWPLNTSLWVKEFRISQPYHAYFLLKTLDFATYNAGSAVPTLNRNHVHNLPLALPPVELIEHFEVHVEPLFHHIQSNERQISTLSNLRDTLLPKLVSGQLCVPEAEDTSEETRA